jgi:hypothetical protein
MQSRWPFDDPPNVAVITLAQIIEQGYPVLYVSHDRDDGAWQFLHDGTNEIEDARLISLRAMVERDQTLLQLADLSLGWYAWRSSATEP